MALTDTQIKQAIADALDGVSLADLATKYSNLATAANTFSAGAIKRGLMARGMTAADVLLWDDYNEYHRDLAVWYACTNSGIGTDYDDKFLEKFDRREELKTVFLTMSGALATFGGTSRISTGDVENPSATPVVAEDEAW